MKRGVFVTGTDTGVGKTIASAALVMALRARGVRVHPFKPIAAGAIDRDGQWVNEDVVALSAAAGLDASAFGRVNPVLLREPMAPHIAAAREGRTLALAPVLAAFGEIAKGETFVVVEGVGGFMVPLGPSLDAVDLCRALGVPVLLVVGLRLGCLNHALLTARAIEEARTPFAGWIANEIDPHMAALEENVTALVERLSAPLLGRLPHRVPPDPRNLAAFLDVDALLRD
jgi:dethiobiotin synthetase